MRETTFTELRNQARHYFDLVEAGEIVRVLRNGKPIAEIRPVQPGAPSWKQRKARPLALSGVDIARLILADRGR
jgi:antitoxin (DNA-binding transcriptional repressor) of toxin-antitoxin stability system